MCAPKAGALGAILRDRATTEEKAIRDRARELLNHVGIGNVANERARSCPTATSAAWKSPALATDPTCWRWTNRPPA